MIFYILLPREDTGHGTQNGEQGHRHPTGPAAALLKIVATNPTAALQALNG